MRKKHPGHETAALRLRVPGDNPRSRAASRLARRRQGDRRRPEPDADAGVPPGAPDAAGRPAQARRAARDQDFGARRRLGAMVRWRDIEDDARLATAHPLLKAAIAHVAHYQIRNRGTVGGSLAHADPAAEMPGIAVTCDAEIAVVGKAGARVIQAADFFQGPLTTALTPDEIITEVRLPAWPARRRWGFQEFARRRGDFAMAGAAVFYDPDESGTRAQRPCRRDRRRRPAAAPGRRGRRAQRTSASTRRRSRRPRPPRPPASIRPTTSMPAAPIGARWSARWSSARSRTPCARSAALNIAVTHASALRSQRQAGRGRGRAAADPGRLPAP